MANDLLDGYIYFLESDAVRNQDWTPTVANIDLTANYTEGTDFCKIAMPKQWAKQMGSGIEVGDASGHKSFMTRTDRASYMVIIMSLEVIGSAVNLIETFFIDSDHTASSGTTFKHYYMVIRRSVSDYEKFTDDSDTRQDYCHGVMLNVEVVWNESTNRTATVKITFRSTWGAV